MKRMTCAGLAVFLVLVVLCGVGRANGFPGEGEGTGQAPYEIVSMEGMPWIRTDAAAQAAHYKLMRDLDFNDDGSYDNPANRPDWTTGAGWEPIVFFEGSFDGGAFPSAACILIDPVETVWVYSGVLGKMPKYRTLIFQVPGFQGATM